VRFLPVWFPLAGFKRHAEMAKKKMDRVEEVPFEWAKKNIVSPRSVLLWSHPSLHLISDFWKFHPVIRFKPFAARKWTGHR
jgi:hypothetical protein